MIKSFNDYQNKAIETAIYPNVGNNLSYPVLGLISEIGEFQIAEPEARKSEHFDCAWYIAVIAYEINTNLDDLPQGEGNVFLSLANLASVAKKAHRDNNNIIQSEKIAIARESLGNIWGDWLRTCRLYEWSPLEGMNQNITKLFSRKRRGKLSGDGDNR